MQTLAGNLTQSAAMVATMNATMEQFLEAAVQLGPRHGAAPLAPSRH